MFANGGIWAHGHCTGLTVDRCWIAGGDGPAAPVNVSTPPGGGPGSVAVTKHLNSGAKSVVQKRLGQTTFYIFPTVFSAILGLFWEKCHYFEGSSLLFWHYTNTNLAPLLLVLPTDPPLHDTLFDYRA